MESQPQNPEFMINTEMFSYGHIKFLAVISSQYSGAVVIIDK